MLQNPRATQVQAQEREWIQEKDNKIPEFQYVMLYIPTVQPCRCKEQVHVYAYFIICHIMFTPI